MLNDRIPFTLEILEFSEAYLSESHPGCEMTENLY